MSQSLTVDLSPAESDDDVLLIWSRFLLQDLMARRERQEEAVTARILIYYKADDGTVILPTMVDAFLGHPASAQPALEVLTPDALGYLVILPTTPVPEAMWKGAAASISPQQVKEMPLRVPTEILPFDRPYTMWVSAALYTRTMERTFCTGFDGEKFSPLKEIEGAYGGALHHLHGIGILDA